MSEGVYQHYRAEEREFIDRAFHWVNEVEQRYSPVLSPFLTPREALIVSQIVGSSDEVRVTFYGGLDNAERGRALLYPVYYEPSIDDYDIQTLRIRFPMKFGELSHGKVLGTLLSTGVDRNRIGDIITDGVEWHVVVDKVLSDFIQRHVMKISNVGVRLEPILPEELLKPIEEWDTQVVIASSLRLDTLIAKIYNLSRQRAKDAVSAGLVKVNFVEMQRPDFEVGVQDIVSVRRKGRFWIEVIEGTTKKDNFKLKVSVIQK